MNTTQTPNNVCVQQAEIPDGNGTKIMFRVVTRYNYSPDPLGGAHRDPIVYECNTLEKACQEAIAVEHFNHQLPAYCSASLARRPECMAAGLSVL